MQSIIFTKTYFSLNFLLTYLCTFLGLITYFFWDLIPDTLHGKAGFLIVGIPILFIYLIDNLYSIYSYPRNIEIDINSKLVKLGKEKCFRFEQLDSFTLVYHGLYYAIAIKCRNGFTIKTKCFYETTATFENIESYMKNLKYKNFQIFKRVI